MKSIRLLLLLASGVTTGAFAPSGGLTDMSQSRFAKMANTELGAVHWTDGFWGDRFNVYSHTDVYKRQEFAQPSLIPFSRNFTLVTNRSSPTSWQRLPRRSVSMRHPSPVSYTHL